MAWEAQAEVPGGFADEAGLVAGLRAGRREAFEALHTAYAARIYNLALRIVDDPEEAQDVAQEVLLNVFRGLPGDETDLNLPAWLYRVTVNKAFDHARARKRRPVTVVDDAVPEAPAAVDEYERAELSRRVESTLRELPKRQQLALVLRDVHGLSVGETASVLGLTKGSADVLLSRARTGFRSVFLSGVGSLTGRCDRADKALAAGVGRGERVPPALLEHSKTCPACRRAVELWGAAPVGLGLLLPQLALPAKLSLGATLAAAQAAGIAVPAGLGAAGAAGASSSAAGGAGLLAALGSATGVKIATLAAVATAAVGIAGVTTQRAHTATGVPGQASAAQPWNAGPAGQGARAGADGAALSPGEGARSPRRPHGGPGAGRVAAGGDGETGQRAGAARDAGSSASGGGKATGAGSSTGSSGGGGGGAGATGHVSDGAGGTQTGGSGAGADSGSGTGSGQGGDGGGSVAGAGETGDAGGGSAGGMLSPE